MKLNCPLSLGVAARIVLVVLVLGLIVNPAGTRATVCVTNPVVTNTNDSGAGSLRQAISEACPGGTITFANTVTGTIALTSGELDLDENLTIQGPGAGVLAINGGTTFRIFNVGSVNPAVNVTISGLTITNGEPGEFGFGGGICSSSTGTVNVTNCTISGNTSNAGFGGGIDNQGTGTVNVLTSTVSGNTVNDGGSGAFGGGICNTGTGTINVTRSTVSGNIATSGGNRAFGGGVFNNNGGGAVNVTNSTVQGNTASGSSGSFGGGVYDGFSGSTVNITDSTISGNTAATGGGVATGNVMNVKDTIIAVNGAGPDAVSFGTLTSQGYNLVGNGDGTPFINGVNHDLVGSTATPLDPKLGPLQNNGGPTLTMALLTGSPAIDQGAAATDPATSASITTDQRGLTRPVDFPAIPNAAGGNGSDIGAFEVQIVFDTCIKDNTNGNLFQFNSTTGAYQFTVCSTGFTLTGTGVITRPSGVLTLTDSKSDRRISAGFNPGTHTGSASIYVMVAQGVWQTFRITDTNPNAVCSCSVVV
jgi:hypothetical protein